MIGYNGYMQCKSEYKVVIEKPIHLKIAEYKIPFRSKSFWNDFSLQDNSLSDYQFTLGDFFLTPPLPQMFVRIGHPIFGSEIPCNFDR